MDKTARYVRALKRIGGAAVLMNLPEPIKTALKETTDLTAKAKMLEAIAEELEYEQWGWSYSDENGDDWLEINTDESIH